MARVHDDYVNQYKSMQRSALQKPIVFVVDMIHGFITEGALHDEAILSCVKPIQALIENQAFPTIFVADAHPADTREFISFPPHCIKGTKESEVVDELQPYITTLFHKNSTNAFTCPDFQEFLSNQLSEYQDIVITGCCTDICILQFALGLNAWLNEHNKENNRIIIPIDCVDTYHIEGIHDAWFTNEFALSNMAANGIVVVDQIKGSD